MRNLDFDFVSLSTRRFMQYILPLQLWYWFKEIGQMYNWIYKYNIQSSTIAVEMI